MNEWLRSNIGWIFLGGVLFVSVVGQWIGHRFGQWLRRRQGEQR